MGIVEYGNSSNLVLFFSFVQSMDKFYCTEQLREQSLPIHLLCCDLRPPESNVNLQKLIQINRKTTPQVDSSTSLIWRGVADINVYTMQYSLFCVSE